MQYFTPTRCRKKNAVIVTMADPCCSHTTRGKAFLTLQKRGWHKGSRLGAPRWPSLTFQNVVPAVRPHPQSFCMSFVQCSAGSLHTHHGSFHPPQDADGKAAVCTAAQSQPGCSGQHSGHTGRNGESCLQGKLLHDVITHYKL